MRNSQEHEGSTSSVRQPGRAGLGYLWFLLPCLVGIASTSRAAPPPPGPVSAAIQVTYREQDLASSTATRNLLRRIGDAALETCGASPFSLAEFRAATKQTPCWRDAVDSAVGRIDNPALSAMARRIRR